MCVGGGGVSFAGAATSIICFFFATNVLSPQAEILLAESCHEQVSFESGFKRRKGRRISEIGWQSSRQKVQES